MSKKRKRQSRRPVPSAAGRRATGGGGDSRARARARASAPRPGQGGRGGARRSGAGWGGAQPFGDPSDGPGADEPAWDDLGGDAWGASARRGGFGAGRGGAHRAEDVERLLIALMARGGRDLAPVRAAVAEVAPKTVVTVGEHLLESAVRAAWAGGWQPVELRWHIRRVAGAEAAVVLDAALTVAAEAWTSVDLHPVWAAQLEELDVAVGDQRHPPRPGWLAERCGSPEALVEPLLALLGGMGRLPQMQVLLPVPGRPDIALDSAAPPVDLDAAGIDARVLGRVRALLAKAEASAFEAEAQAFTAKAHELMTRHSLEHAMVVGGASTSRDRPTARRLLIDDPYAEPKALLVQLIAEASRCRAVSLGDLQMSTVVGFAADVESVEVLFTSLLVQAQTALQELARRTRAGSRERSRGFRSSFLRGFAHRIGERLEASGQATVDDVDRARGGALVPVLAARQTEVDEQTAELFPRLRMRAGSAPTDTLGFHAGSDAAERADLPWQHLGART